MAIQDLLAKLKELERPISDIEKESLLTHLREHQTMDGRPRPTTLTNKANIYFHSIQDTRTADMFMMLQKAGKIEEYSDIDDYLLDVQACFVQDLDRYLKLLPISGNEEVIKVFELVFSVGTSAYWHEDRELIKNFGKLYRQIDEKFIRAWANAD